LEVFAVVELGGHGEQEVLPGASEYVDLGQRVQLWEAGVLEKEPGGHWGQEERFWDGPKVPGAHGGQKGRFEAGEA